MNAPRDKWDTVYWDHVLRIHGEHMLEYKFNGDWACRYAAYAELAAAVLEGFEALA